MTERNEDTQPHDDDLVPEDDAVIGRAARRSLLVLLGLLALGAAAFWIVRRPPAAGPVQKIPSTAPHVTATDATPPAVRFTDVTAAAGIDFTHANGAYGEKLLPETMGGGVAFFDYDGDSRQDLLFTNGTSWPGRSGPTTTAALYRNVGGGRFVDTTAAAGLAVPLYGMGVAVGDFDNDGDVDLFCTGVGGNRLFANRGGRFEDVTRSAGVGGDPLGWTTAAAFVDIDNDGRLDLYVGEYVRWSKEIDLEVDYRLTGVGRAYGPPANYEGTDSHLYKNNGDGSFTEITAAAGLRMPNVATGRPIGKALGIAPVDVDGDGWMDLIVANDTAANFFFRNRGNATFEELGTASGLAYDRMGNATGAMGIDTGRYRNDGALAVVIGNFANEMTSVYVSQGDPTLFADEAITEGVGAPSRRTLKFGVFLFDYDLDGRLDLLETNGHLEEEIAKVDPSQSFRQPAHLFWNAGAATRQTFALVPPESTGDLARPLVGRGSAYADFDGDGDLDVVLAQVGDRPLLLRNDQATGHHWLRVRLVGAATNRDAIGAGVELTAGGVTQRRQVMPTKSYLSQSELPVTFGLGAHAKVESLRVLWPGGKTQEVSVDAVDREIVVVEEGAAAGTD
jgi:enediyne biosynthesis protein E4